MGTVRRARGHRKSHRLESGYFDYPKICLTGLWLEDAAFLLDQRYEVEGPRGELVPRTLCGRREGLPAAVEVPPWHPLPAPRFLDSASLRSERQEEQEGLSWQIGGRVFRP